MVFLVLILHIVQTWLCESDTRNDEQSGTEGRDGPVCLSVCLMNRRSPFFFLFVLRFGRCHFPGNNPVLCCHMSLTTLFTFSPCPSVHKHAYTHTLSLPLSSCRHSSFSSPSPSFLACFLFPSFCQGQRHEYKAQNTTNAPITQIQLPMVEAKQSKETEHKLLPWWGFFWLFAPLSPNPRSLNFYFWSVCLICILLCFIKQTGSFVFCFSFCPAKKSAFCSIHSST